MLSMSDFFSGLSSGNIRLTDAQINQGGPLPGEPYASVDGRYNFNSELLQGINNYAGPKNGSMGSDRNYQQIPHRKQMVVPPLYLPEPQVDTKSMLKVSHPVDMGDLVFIMCLNKNYVVLTDASYWVENSSERMTMYSTVFPLCNICTLNYIMLGLQNAIVQFCETRPANATLQIDLTWNRLLIEFGVQHQVYALKSMFDNTDTPQLTSIDPVTVAAKAGAAKPVSGWSAPCILKLGSILKHVFQHGFKPFGIAAGSEKQGGLHETGLAPVQAAASHYTTLTVDGQNRDLVNIWQGVDVQAGDNLILRCDFVEEPMMQGTIYVLNHYYKERQTREIPIAGTVGGRWQVIPDVLKQSYNPKYVIDSNQTTYAYARSRLSLDNVEAALNEDNVAADVIAQHELDVDLAHQVSFRTHATANVENIARSLLDYRHTGYWRIAQCFTKHKGGMWNAEIVPINDMQYTKGHLLLQVTFAPVFVYHNLAKCTGKLNSASVANMSSGKWCAEQIHAFCRMSRLRRFPIDPAGPSSLGKPGVIIPKGLMTGQKRGLDATNVLTSGTSTVQSTDVPMQSAEVEPKKAPAKKRKEPLLKSAQPLNVTYGELSENPSESNKEK